MNERIKEFAKQAGFYKYGDDFEDIIEKFAELIVQECADLCLKHETFQGPFNKMEYRKGSHFNTMIKAHFGVEE